MNDPPEARSVINAAGSQAGDLSFGNVAGGGIYHGLTGEQLSKILEKQSEFYMTLVTAYERQYKEVTQAIQDVRDELDMYRAGEANARKARQEALDRRLNLISGVLIALSVLFLIYITANL